jgi:hypothetical protein
MKAIVVLFLCAITAGTLQAQYIDLSTGKTVTLVKHNGTGMMYNTQTQRPVYIYIDPATNDTFYGRTREKINGKVILQNGKYFYTGDEMYIYDGDYRLKTEADSIGYKRKAGNDGDIKVKYGDYKRKIEGDGDIKVKEDETKIKMNTDGTLKVKDSTYSKKIDDKGNFREKDDSAKVKLKTDGSMKVKDKRDNFKGKIDENGDVKVKDDNQKRKTKRDKQKTKRKDEKTETP